MSAHGQRMDRLRHALREEGLDAFLVADTANVTYLSGFRGDSGCLVVSADHVWLITDGRYVEQAEAEAPQCEVVRHEASWVDEAAKTVAKAGARRLGFEPDVLSFATHAKLAAALDGVEAVPRARLTESLREVKDAAEIERIRQAVEAAERAFLAVREQLAPGQTEREAATLLEFQMSRFGARKAAFETIVAARERSSLAHAAATDAALGAGDAVLFDWGAVRDLYCSDCTRVVFLGAPGRRWREIYEVVLGAQERGLAAIRAGVPIRDVDAAARRHIEAAGHGEAFVHGLGHGVGLRVHESPTLNARADGVLAEGMVVTVEPGVYLPGWGGVRIEDLAVVRQDGAEVLTRLPKTLDAAIL